jgi:hypothetical protein
VSTLFWLRYPFLLLLSAAVAYLWYLGRRKDA